MQQWIEWCNNIYVYTLIGLLIPSLAWHVKSLRNHMKKHVLHWQWVVRSEPKPESDPNAEAGATSGGMSKGWQWAAVIVIVGLLATLVAVVIHYGSQ